MKDKQKREIKIEEKAELTREEHRGGGVSSSESGKGRSGI
jgi:hypothetical protein